MLSSDCKSFKPIRRGTKSCSECRQRKIKCVWHDPTDHVCVSCKARSRQCNPQLYARRSAGSGKSTSKDRIARLEQQIANIAASVHNRPGPAADLVNDDGDESETSIDCETQADYVGAPGPTPPTHLRLLFDNALIEPARGDGSTHTGQHQVSERYLDHARLKLQRLLPTREDVSACSSYAAPWMSIYYELFPSTSTTTSRDAMVSRQDDMSKPDADPIAIAQFLLSFGVTLLQVPKGEVVDATSNWSDVDTWVQAIMTTVRTVIVENSTIASSVEGIAASLLYLRLQLGRGNFKELWLTLRRIIALAELNGLPRAWYAQSSGKEPGLLTGGTDKVALWESICATDRLASMLLNLPAATSTHHFPQKQTISSAGEVLMQPYMFELASIAMRVQLHDESFLIGQEVGDVYERILIADKDVRELKARTEPSWWREWAEHLSGDLLVQYWHHYLLVRLHLRAAMSADAHDQYSYSRVTCTEACRAVARRYAHVRRALPTGFFICRIIDIQAFTAATYLLLSSVASDMAGAPTRGPLDEMRLASVEQIVSTMEFVSDMSGSEFAQSASAAIRALTSHLEKPAASTPDGLTLRIPLLGQVHIRRKATNAEQGQTIATDVNSQHQSLHLQTQQYSAPPQPYPAEVVDPTYAQEGPNEMSWMMEFDLSSTIQNNLFSDNIGDFEWQDGGDPMSFF